MIANLDEDNEEIEKKMSTLKKASKKFDMGLKLHDRIEYHITKSNIKKSYGDLELFLAELPDNLREEIIEITHSGVYLGLRAF